VVLVRGVASATGRYCVVGGALSRF
jgi:hypothetical protein